MTSLTKHAWRVFTVLIALLLAWVVLWGIPAQAGAASRPCKHGTVETIAEGITRHCVHGTWKPGPTPTALPSKTKVRR